MWDVCGIARTSYTVCDKGGVERFEPMGREVAAMMGNGEMNCWKEGWRGTFDHSWPAPCAVSFV